MSKIVQAVNAMISNPEKITSIIKGRETSENEYFFLYKNKYKWSVAQVDIDEYNIFYYVDNMSLAEIEQISRNNWKTLNFVTYKTSEIRTKEAFESFSELYRVVSEKAFGLDEMFNDIISDMDDLPF